MGIWDKQPEAKTMQEAVEIAEAGTRDKQIERLLAEIDRLRAESERETGRAETAIETLNETRDEIELLRKRRQTELLAPSISWDGFLVSGMQESIDEVCRLIDLEKRGHK